MTDMNTADVKRLVVHAVEDLLARDAELLKRNVNERTITHRLAIYLERRLPEEWDVDCEYNRDFDDAKKLDLPPRANLSSDDIYARTVFPDIIVHRRAPKKQRNLLVIEAKKTTNPEAEADWDWIKLERFRKEFMYEVTAFLKLTSHDPRFVPENERRSGKSSSTLGTVAIRSAWATTRPTASSLLRTRTRGPLMTTTEDVKKKVDDLAKRVRTVHRKKAELQRLLPGQEERARDHSSRRSGRRAWIRATSPPRGTRSMWSSSRCSSRTSDTSSRSRQRSSPQT